MEVDTTSKLVVFPENVSSGGFYIGLLHTYHAQHLALLLIWVITILNTIKWKRKKEKKLLVCYLDT